VIYGSLGCYLGIATSHVQPDIVMWVSVFVLVLVCDIGYGVPDLGRFERGRERVMETEEHGSGDVQARPRWVSLPLLNVGVLKINEEQNQMTK
jgi:hypothetical protein